MSSLDRFVLSKLKVLEKASLKRTLVATERGAGAAATRANSAADTPLISFCCNDYLGLSQHPKVKEAARAAVDRYGAGAGASRHITGNHPLLDELEQRLAHLKGTEACVVFGSGYLTNLGVIPCFAGQNDIVLVDELAHACLNAGASLSRAHVEQFRHNDVAHVREILEAQRAKFRHALILTDGVFSMDGDLAPIPDLSGLAEEFDAWLMTDDAHGIGVLADGRGSTYVWGDQQDRVDVPLQMGTLSKAIGSYGGYLCASKPVVDFIKTRARSLIYTTALPPASAGAALAALDIIESDPAFCALPLQKAQHFTTQLGLPEATSPVVPIVIGGAEDALKASQLLEREGFLVTAIRPPTVPRGTARLRLAFSADHKEGDIARLADIIQTQILKETA